MECCQEVTARRRAKNDPNVSMVGYEDIGEAAYGSFGRRLVSTTMYTELLGICALLFILEVHFLLQNQQLQYLCRSGRGFCSTQSKGV